MFHLYRNNPPYAEFRRLLDDPVELVTFEKARCQDDLAVR